jgi:1,4-alpha-glucan branching enzyme
MWAHPGKKLLFMGGEFGQWNEWNDETSLDWNLLDFPLHAGVSRLIRDLNGLYRHHPALHQVDFEPAGFEWMAADDADCSVVAFVRWTRDRSRAILYVGNFTPVVRHGYRIGVPTGGQYVERINSDSEHYGGSNVGNGSDPLTAEQIPAHGREWSLSLTLPPLAALYLEWLP